MGAGRSLGLFTTDYNGERMIAISARQAWYAAQRMKWQPLGCAKTIFRLPLKLKNPKVA